MRQDSFIFFFDIFFSGKILSFLVELLSKNKRHKKYRLIGFIISALFLLGIHAAYFISKKEPNFFEILNLPRVFEMKDLEERILNFKRVKQTTFINKELKLSQIKEILGNVNLRNSYDKFNTRHYNKIEEMMSISQHFQRILYQKVVENSIYYIIMTVVIIISSDDENSRKSRKWVIATMVAFFFMELNYLFLNNNEKDFIDFIFPFMSIFERIQLARDLLMPFLFIIKYFYFFFYKDSFYDLRKNMTRNTMSQKNITGVIDNKWGKQENSEPILKNFEVSLVMLTEYLKKKEKNKKKAEKLNKGFQSEIIQKNIQNNNEGKKIEGGNNKMDPENQEKSISFASFAKQIVFYLVILGSLYKYFSK